MWITYEELKYLAAKVITESSPVVSKEIRLFKLPKNTALSVKKHRNSVRNSSVCLFVSRTR
jgi:hypothetical protein